MFTYEIDHVVCEENEPVIAYIKVLEASTGKVVKTICMNYVKETFVTDMQARMDKLKAVVETKLTIEAEIRNTLTANEAAITAGKGETQ